ncbi:unnamed protein product [Lampetra fluviatilis]
MRRAASGHVNSTEALRSVTKCLGDFITMPANGDTVDESTVPNRKRLPGDSGSLMPAQGTEQAPAEILGTNHKF